MAPLVRGHDAYTAVEFAENAAGDTWGAAPSGTTPYHYKRIPIISETMTLNREFYPKTNEYGESGAVPYMDQGRAFVSGSITFAPRYNQEWFWALMGQFFWDEVINTPNLDYTGAALTGANQHAFSFASTVPKGFALKIWTGGASAAGYIQTFLGCMITRMVWEQPEDDVPRITLDILGKSTSLSSLSGTPSDVGELNDGAVTTPQYVKPRDLSNSVGTWSKFQTGATLTQLNIRGFTLTVDRHIEFETAFATAPDTPEQPGVTETRDITMEIRSLLEQDFGGTNKPYKEFVDRTTSKCRVQYASPNAMTGSARYVIMLDFPAVVWEEARASVSEPGAPPTNFKWRAISGTFATPATPPAAASDMRILTHVLSAEDADDEFSVL